MSFLDLLKVIEAGEKETNLRMDSWEDTEYDDETGDPCGTSHCLIGAFCTQNDDPLYYSSHTGDITLKPGDLDVGFTNVRAISKRFSITVKESRWLFTSKSYPLSRNNTKDALWLTKEEALNRLRKFVCYKLRKSMMSLEEARRIYGNDAVVVASKTYSTVQETATNVRENQSHH